MNNLQWKRIYGEWQLYNGNRVIDYLTNDNGITCWVVERGQAPIPINSEPLPTYEAGMEFLNKYFDAIEADQRAATELREKALKGLIYNDEYRGPRFRYGYRSRPFGIGHQPKGFIIGSQRRSDHFRYGTIDFPFKLTPEEIYQYELTRLDFE
jgi:hypothetical protein